MATAQPGETIYTTWEQNGHMNNASPTKVYILYYADSTKEFVTVSERTTAPVAGSFNFATTANCYSTESNSVCLGQWVIPKNLVPGSTYHFVWFWYFNQNPAGEWYSTCFDVNIQDKSHVVGTADMATLLQKGDPPDSYAYGINSVVESLIAQVTTLPENVAAPSSTPKSTSSSTSSSPTQTPMVAATTTAADKAESDVIPASTATALGRELYVSESSLPAYTKKCRQRPLKRT
ncbi:hypothetical protein EV175_002144 [Coemansia sp. RSA 1933]|nr:hypothetical protein EV175_002144 [Coemansia sp. RSA 1933]